MGQIASKGGGEVEEVAVDWDGMLDLSRGTAVQPNSSVCCFDILISARVLVDKVSVYDVKCEGSLNDRGAHVTDDVCRGPAGIGRLAFSNGH